jgi:hypothetical protein
MRRPNLPHRDVHAGLLQRGADHRDRLVAAIVDFYAQIVGFPVDRGLYRPLAPAFRR